MAGASASTKRITHLNANWSPGGALKLLIVTEDDARRTAPASAEMISMLSDVVSRGGVLLWDPEAETMIIGNILGEWIPQDWSSGRDDQPTGAAF